MTGDIFIHNKTVTEFTQKNGHIINGIWLPRVTSVLEIVAKPGLLRYYAQQKNYLEAQEGLRRAADMGLKIHDVCEQMILGNGVHIPPKMERIVEIFQQWLNKHHMEVYGVEKKIIDADRHFYCGTADVLAKIDGEMGILDIKTGSGIWNEYSLQTAAYLQAYNQNVGAKNKASASWILRLDQYRKCKLCGARMREKEDYIRITGGKTFCKHEFSEIEADLEFKKIKNLQDSFKAFINAKGLWEWANQRILKQIENYPKNMKI